MQSNLHTPVESMDIPEPKDDAYSVTKVRHL